MDSGDDGFNLLNENEADPRVELGERIAAEIKTMVRTPGLMLNVTCSPGEDPFEIVVLLSLLSLGGSRVEDIKTLINDHLLEMLKETAFEPYKIKPALEILP
jgi:hypothetical protein